jgi:NAD(P)H-quinone oxidoreductase subunit 5
LSAGVLLLAYQTNDFTLSGIITKVGELAAIHTLIAGVCIITATIVQSAIYPFHRWLLSAMTSAYSETGFDAQRDLLVVQVYC